MKASHNLDLSLALSLGAPGGMSPVFPDDWAGYATATPDNPGSEVTDNIFLVSLNDMPTAWWAAVNEDGSDIRVTDASNNLIARDKIHFDKGSETGLLVFSLTKTTSSQPVRIWAGSPNAREPGVTSEFGQHAAYPSTVRGFWPDGGGNDRTSFANHLSPTGSPTLGGTTGPISGSLATDFNGSDESFQGAVSVPTAAPLTLEGYGASDSITANQYLLCLANATPSEDEFFALVFRGGEAGDFLQARSNEPAANATSSPNGYSSGAFYHAVARFSSPNARTAALDGVLGTTNTDSSTPAGVNEIGIAVLNWGAGDNFFFEGDVSLVFLHTVALSDDAIAYRAGMADQTTFWNGWSWVAA